jgi:hypothetical protein
MTYTVLWTRTAEDELAALWLNAPDRRAVTEAAKAADEALHDDASMKGESRVGQVRILFIPPLGTEFKVVEDDRTVYVLTVWAPKPRRSLS